MVSMTRGATRGTRRDADPRRRSRRQLRRLPAQAEGRNDRLAGQLHDLHPAPPEAASGTLEPRHVVVPLREMCPHAELVLGRVNGHDRSAHVGTTLESFDGTEAVLADGTRIPARTLVWTAGVRASPLLPDLVLPLDEKGRVLVDETMRVEGSEDVWALGDCAAVKNVKTPGVVDPPTCQHALRQARHLAKNLTRPPKPCGYRMLGQVATLGRFKGIAELPAIHLWGFPGWFVARSYHLYQLPLFTRKVRVVADWTVALFFRRDIVELSMLGQQRHLGD